jgi:hypothetical protein
MIPRSAGGGERLRHIAIFAICERHERQRHVDARALGTSAAFAIRSGAVIRRLTKPAPRERRTPSEQERNMAGRECYHCKQWVEEGEKHDCWTTTEAALTQDLSEDLRDAWERLRETAASFGDQRIYASHKSIMFSRTSCYFFVRPKKSFLEVCVFLGRALKAPQVRRVDRASKAKVVHFIQIRHRDEVEAPLTDWLQEAYELADVRIAKATTVATPKPGPDPKKKKATRKTVAGSKSTRQ